jgi:hypothetical protein
MTLTAHRPQEGAPSPAGDAREAFDQALKTLLRTWHEYEVLRALGAPRDTVSAAHGALEQARSEVARHRPPPHS